MIPNHITHPLRVIKLQHINEEPLNEYEASAMKEYLRLHDAAYDLVRRRDVMAGEELKLELWLQKCDDGFPAVEREIINCGPAAGYTWEELDKLGVSEGESDLGMVVQIVATYQDKVTEWLDATKALYATYLKWSEEVTKLGEDIDKFDDDYNSKMILAHNDHTLDSGSLYDDWEEFYDVQFEFDGDCAFVKTYTEYHRKQNEYIDKANKLFDRANLINEAASEVLKSKSNSGFGLN